MSSIVLVDTFDGDCEFVTVGFDDIICFGRLLEADPANKSGGTRSSRWRAGGVTLSSSRSVTAPGAWAPSWLELVEGVNVIAVPLDSDTSLGQMLVPVDGVVDVVVLD